MLLSEFIKKLNVGMVINGFKIISTGSQEEIDARAALLSKYTVMITDTEGTIVGIKPVSVQEPDKITVTWQLSKLQKFDDRWFHVAVYQGPFKIPENDFDLDDVLLTNTVTATREE